MFEIAKLPQIPSINHWMRSGGGTSERGEDSAIPDIRGISDEHVVERITSAVDRAQT